MVSGLVTLFQVTDSKAGPVACAGSGTVGPKDSSPYSTPPGTGTGAPKVVSSLKSVISAPLSLRRQSAGLVPGSACQPPHSTSP